MARMFYGKRLRLILSKPARIPSVELRRVLNWVPLERRREMFRLLQVHRCMTKRAPKCLGDRLKRNEDVGNCRTRGRHKLFVPMVKSESF